MIVTCLTLALLVAPHDGPAKRIAMLTKRMATVGRTAPLLHQRALCHLEIRQPGAALLDLDGALALRPDHEAVLVERVRLLAAMAQPERALAAAALARPRLRSRPHVAALARAEATILTQRGRYRDALARTKKIALDAVHDQPAVVLHRSALLAKLGEHTKRLAELQIRIDRMRKAGCVLPVIEHEWIDALIDAGHVARARPLVDQRLRDSRFGSAWLLRRARIHRSLGHEQLAQTDLLAALRELSGRIRHQNPDLLLVADRAKALRMLGQTSAAHEDLALLRRRNFPAVLLLRAERP